VHAARGGAEANGPGQYGEGRVNTITLPAGTYVLTIPGKVSLPSAGDLDVIGQLEIDGAGAATTIIDAAHSTVFSVVNTQDLLTLPASPCGTAPGQTALGGRDLRARDDRARRQRRPRQTSRRSVAGSTLLRDARQERGDRELEQRVAEAFARTTPRSSKAP